MFNNILFILPVMGYFALEAIVVGVVITLVWKLFLANFIFDINYLQVVAIYWIIKILLFDVFKLVAGFESIGRRMQRNKENDADNSEYNESITP